jgi:hypothetical protein
MVSGSWWCVRLGRRGDVYHLGGRKLDQGIQWPEVTAVKDHLLNPPTCPLFFIHNLLLSLNKKLDTGMMFRYI